MRCEKYNHLFGRVPDIDHTPQALFSVSGTPGEIDSSLRSSPFRGAFGVQNRFALLSEDQIWQVSFLDYDLG
jgi:hypothetical protein